MLVSLLTTCTLWFRIKPFSHVSIFLFNVSCGLFVCQGPQKFHLDLFVCLFVSAGIEAARGKAGVHIVPDFTHSRHEFQRRAHSFFLAVLDHPDQMAAVLRRCLKSLTTPHWKRAGLAGEKDDPISAHALSVVCLARWR